MILASKSPRRISLMQQAGFDVEVQPANIDEEPLYAEKPEELVRRLAYNKAATVLESLGENGQNELILAADSIVWIDNTILGKPKDRLDAMRMLKLLSGRTHHVTSGVCIMYQNKTIRFNDTTDVTFYELDDHIISSYINSQEPMDKAGSYAIQGKGRVFVKSINGNYYNVVGLPIARVIREIDKLCKSDYLCESVGRSDV